MHSKRFTLIEFIIVLILLSILTMTALPTYHDYQRRQKLELAVSKLSQLELQLKSYYEKKGRYSRGKRCAIKTPDDDYFNYTCKGRKKRFYLVASNKLTPELGDPGDFIYTLNHRGNKKTKKFAGQDVKKRCWLLSVHDC